MQGAPWIRLVVVFAVFAAAVASARAATADVRGAQDPLGMERYPHAEIVGYHRDEEYLPREFMVGRVDTPRRDIERETRPSARREWATYELPAGTETRAVADHYLAQLGAGALFSCRGRDCGRSNQWANDVFGQAMLYGPDQSQFYLAAEYGKHLVAVYVIERGNKRVYAHVEVLEPEVWVSLRGNAELMQRLTGTGLATIGGVVPARDGSLSAEALELLDTLALDLASLAGQTIYLVCHLYGPDDVPVLLDRSQRCAEAAAVRLLTAEGPGIEPFGAGPLLPRVGGAISRLELVLPHRLGRD